MQTCGHAGSYSPNSLTSEVTYISSDTSNDHLFLSGGLDGSTEVSVIPGIDLAAPADDSNIGVHFGDLRYEWSVRA